MIRTTFFLVSIIIFLGLSGCGDKEPDLTQQELPVKEKHLNFKNIEGIQIPAVTDPFTNQVDESIKKKAFLVKSIKNFNPLSLLVDDYDLKVIRNPSLDRQSAIGVVEAEFYAFVSFQDGGVSLVLLEDGDEFMLNTSKINLENRYNLPKFCNEKKTCHGKVYFSVEKEFYYEDYKFYLLGIERL